MATITTTTDGSVRTDTCSSAIARNTSSLVYSVTKTTDSGFHFNTIPTYSVTSSNFNVVVSDQVFNSDNQLTGVKFSFFYSITDTDVVVSAGEKITFDEPSVSADRSQVQYIRNAFFLSKDFNQNGSLKSSESSATLRVTGAENATYKLKIENSIGLTYDFSNDTFTRSLTFSSEQKIETNKTQTLLGRQPGANNHAILIPEHFSTNTIENIYTITVTPTGSTKSNVEGTSSEPLTFTNSQLGLVSFNFNVAESTYGIAAASSQIKSISNKTAFSNLSTFNPSDFPTLNANNNCYFSYSQALSYSSTTTTDTAVAGGRNITLDSTTAALKLRVGDSVTGTNIAEGTTITALDPAGTSSITISTDIVSYPLVDETTLTFGRVVGVTRQPTGSDIRTTSPITTNNGIRSSIECFTSRQIVNSKIIELIDNSAIDNLVVGMLAQSNNIIGFPKIENISGRTVFLTTAQSLPENEIIQFSVSGVKVEIQTINVTGAGTASPKLNVIGYVERLGVENVVAEVVLSNFLDDATYGTVVASAGTATCALSGGVKISPLTEPQTLSNITISEITSSGSGTTALSSDKTQIKYLAPSSGTSDTISYKVTDGVSTSAAANIVITLTP
tara:strand:- start:158 stop:2008 length:1851 start_codon:yes stop_codon:yes gene_type:complete